MLEEKQLTGDASPYLDDDPTIAFADTVRTWIIKKNKQVDDGSERNLAQKNVEHIAAVIGNAKRRYSYTPVSEDNELSKRHRELSEGKPSYTSKSK